MNQVDSVNSMMQQVSRKPEATGNAGRFHGATEVIRSTDIGSRVTFRIYPDGIRVGCTFITQDAVRKLMAELKVIG